MSTEKPIDKLPARILIQVREGVPNLLADFEIPIYETKPLDPRDPDAINGAKLGHKIDVTDIYRGLARAQRRILRQIRQEGHLSEYKDWLDKMHEWVMSA